MLSPPRHRKPHRLRGRHADADTEAEAATATEAAACVLRAHPCRSLPCSYPLQLCWSGARSQGTLRHLPRDTTLYVGSVSHKLRWLWACTQHSGNSFSSKSSPSSSRPGRLSQALNARTATWRASSSALSVVPPPRRRTGQKGRPRVRGKRLRSPEKQAGAKNAAWKKVSVTAYGKTAVVRVLVIDALWYVVGGSERLRLVVVRDFPGHDKDDVFVCTDPTLPPRHIIESYSKRWSLAVSFHEAKGKLVNSVSRTRVTAPNMPSNGRLRWP